MKDKNSEKYISQLPISFLIITLVVLFGLFLYFKSWMLSFYWFTGIGFGFVLQRSRFCFVSAIRDPYLTGNTSLTKALLLALAITTVGFTIVKYTAYIKGLPIPAQTFVFPISFATIAGGILFGFGMVLAGGCASGVLMRTGEGYQTQIIALIFFIIGLLAGARDLPWWQEKFIAHGNTVFLPDIVGWIGALTIQLLFIALLYFIADKWQSKKNEDF